jgi:hypothetical protein
MISSEPPEEPDDDPLPDRWHRIVIPEAADVPKIFGDDIDPSRKPFADCGKLLPSSGSLDPDIWGVS